MIPDPFNHDPKRVTLTFSLDGLAAREELLFKSFVRILDHRTHHHWIYKPGQADLRVLAQTLDPSDMPGHGMNASSPVLIVGMEKQLHRHFLALPIHADALEAELNALGDLVNLPEPLMAPDSNLIGVDDAVRLVRWPTTTTLRSHQVGTRIAAMLSKRAMTVNELAKITQESVEQCHCFIALLGNLKLLEISPRQAAATLTAVPSPAHPGRPVQRSTHASLGLVAGVRRFLGIQG